MFVNFFVGWNLPAQTADWNRLSYLACHCDFKTIETCHPTVRIPSLAVLAISWLKAHWAPLESLGQVQRCRFAIHYIIRCNPKSSTIPSGKEIVMWISGYGWIMEHMNTLTSKSSKSWSPRHSRDQWFHAIHRHWCGCPQFRRAHRFRAPRSSHTARLQSLSSISGYCRHSCTTCSRLFHLWIFGDSNVSWHVYIYTHCMQKGVSFQRHQQKRRNLQHFRKTVLVSSHSLNCRTYAVITLCSLPTF